MKKFSVVLPTKDHNGKSLQYRIKKIMLEIMTLTGGCSWSSQWGSWVDTATGVIYTEPSKVVYTFANEQQIASLMERVPQWAVDLKQIELLVSTEEASVNFIQGTRELAKNFTPRVA